MVKDIQLEDKMFYWFIARTEKHIDLVYKYCKRLSLLEGLEGILERAEGHDLSKFQPEETEPYMWLAWDYKYKAENKTPLVMPSGMKDRIKAATLHHILNNSHHPEFHQSRTTGLLNEEDRDKPPAEAVDATKMEDLDIAEMVADWCAISEERGSNPFTWAEANVNVRWTFTSSQVDKLFNYLQVAWGE
jgi:hypothetical protein